MSELFKNKYRIASARLQNWNYANEGMYFVTICTKNRENYFGNIDSKGIFKPTEIGEIAYSEWFNAINIRPDMNLKLGEFVVMPNHVHGIIIIGENDFNAGLSGSLVINVRGAMHCASNIDIGIIDCETIENNPEYKNQFAPQSKNLSSIIRGYKSSVTTFARKNGIDFGWQPLFYEHIIRSQNDFDRISNYIIQNPSNWAKDKFQTDQ
jgi:REP element-mobilizing transposase RayT